MAHLYALDFDGVLCDSCGESSISALKAAKLRWPERFKDISKDAEVWILESMRTVRPVVETGYENVLLVRLLFELKHPHLQSSSALSHVLNKFHGSNRRLKYIFWLHLTNKVVDGLTVHGILENWERLKPILMKDWGENNKQELVDLFGAVRDDWISQDIHGWISANRFYPGTADSLKFATSPVYIVTTKQARFAAALLKELAGVNFPIEHIYGLGSGPKVEVLKQLQSEPEHQGMTLHFVEDRLGTLLNVIKDPELENWNLYLGTWGYNTLSERNQAAINSRIHLLDLPDFCAKLK